MQVCCPHCRSPIEVVDLSTRDEILCPSCGSTFRLVDQSTTGWQRRDGQTIGRFEVLDTLGMGAFGTVFKARDPQLDRLVAVKVPRAGSLIVGEELDRFLREARSAAQLRHPSIVAVHEVGEVDGVPYLVSDFVAGLTLADVLSGRQPTFRESAELVAQVADALQYAHDHGVVHRDVKPSNIMIGENGAVHVMDFGLAKRDSGEITMTVEGQVLGTPAYMSPEQAHGEGHKVDGRSDTYSLGVILYRLLAGELPFHGTTRMLLHQVRHDEPRAPRALNDSVPRDQETICLKAMAKEPGRRYARSGDLADDLRRFLNGEPIHARRPGALQQAWFWARRHPTTSVLVPSIVLTALAVVVAGVGMAYNARLERAYNNEAEARGSAEEARTVAEQQRGIADEQKQKAQMAQRQAEKALGLANSYAYFHRIALADAALRDNNVLRAEQLLDDCPAALRHWEWFYLKNQCHGDLLTIQASPEGGTLRHALSPDGRHVATTSLMGVLKVWDVRSGREIWSTPTDQEGSRSVAYRPDGRQLATGGQDGTIKLWDAQTGKPLAMLRGPRRAILTLAYRPDGRQLASAGEDRPVRLWDVDKRREERALVGHTSAVPRVAYSPDGQRLASASWDATVRVWGTKDGRTDRVMPTEQGSLFAVAFSPDGRLLASGGMSGTVKLWSAKDGRLLHTLQGHVFTIQAVAFSPDGSGLSSCSSDGTVRTWSVLRGRARATYRGHQGHVLGVGLTSTGDRLVSCGVDGTVKVWDAFADPGATHVRAGAHAGRTGSVRRTRARFSPDGRWLLTLGEVVELRDAHSGQTIRPLPSLGDFGLSRIYEAAFSPDSSRVAIAVGHEPVTIDDVKDGRIVRTIRDPQSSGAVAFDRAGRRLAIGGRDGAVRIWDVNSGEKTMTLPGGAGYVSSIAYRADGRRIAAVAFADSGVRIWDTRTGRSHRVLQGKTKFGLFGVRFSPDGRRLAATSKEGTAEIWDVATGATLRVLQGHQGVAYDLAFSPDGRRLATCGMDRTVKIWDVETGQEALTLRGLTNQGQSVAFHPDGQHLVASDLNQLFLIWHGDDLAANVKARRAAVDGLRRVRFEASAAEALSMQQWASALWFYDRLLQGGPDVKLHAGRALAHANLEHWDEAARDLRAVCDLPGAPLQVWAWRALVCQKRNDAAGRRQALTGLLERFGKDDPEQANGVAWACALAPDGGPDAGKAVKLAEMAVAKARTSNHLNTLGAIEYRAGKFADAIKHLQEGMKLDGRGGTVWDWLFLAMAHHRLGQGPEARKWLTKATAWIDEATAKKAAESVRPPLAWDQRLELRLLRQEAEALLAGP